VEVAGKTGTAQLASNDYLKGSSAGRKLKDNAWFVGFAPRHAPEIVVVALFEHGEHGQLAAPIVRDVMKAYFDKKARLSAAAQEQQTKSLARLTSVRSLNIPGLAPVVAAAPLKPTPGAGEGATLQAEVPESRPRSSGLLSRE
jgi:penicillin-binding protein 2